MADLSLKRTISHNEANPTNRIIRQGRALVRAIESLTTIDPFERAIAGLLVAGYKRGLRGIVELCPRLDSGEL